MCHPHEMIILVVDEENKLDEICSRLVEEVFLTRLVCVSTLWDVGELLDICDFDMVFCRSTIDPHYTLALTQGKKVVYYADTYSSTDPMKAWLSGAGQFLDIQRRRFDYVGDVIHGAVDVCILKALSHV